MKRKEFIRSSFLLGSGLALVPKFFAQDIIPSSNQTKKFKKLTILHTNDTHSQIDPFPMTHSKFPGMGGVVARQTIIEKVRSEESNVLLLDAGDIFQGTPYFNKYHGVLEMKVMTALKYDASTMGNHDFDAGLDGFLKAKKEANFPFLCSNYNFEKTILNSQTIENTIIEKDGIKIGIFGLGVELEGLVPDNKFGDTVYLNPIEVAIGQVKKLQGQNCDLIICLSHLGYEYENADKISDKILAQETAGIHLIIGGHTHTFLAEPTIMTNSAGEKVIINQMGWAGVNLGRIDFYFEEQMRAVGGLVKVG